MTHSPLRRIVHLFVPALLIAAMLAVLPAVTTSVPAAAADPTLSCTDTLYATEGQYVYSVNPATGAMTQVADQKEGINALAVSPGGASAYVMSNTSASGVGKLFRVGNATPVKTIGGLATSTSVPAGAIDPTTGHYWFGQAGSNDSKLNIHTVDPSASGNVTTSTAKVTIDTGFSTTLGTDIAFDSRGNLYIVMSQADAKEKNLLLRLSAAQLDTGGQQTPVQQTPVPVTSLPNGSFPGIAFGSDGYIYVQGGTSLRKLKPTNGTPVGTSVATKLGSTDKTINDLGSCATPGVMDTVVKDVVSRKNPTDQFTVSLTGDLSSSANTTGTTAGTDTGPQIQAGEFAGPSLVLPGTSYNFAEVGAKSADAPAGTANANLNDYISTYACVNNNTRVVITSGTGTSGTLTVPPSSTAGTGASVTCTITNEVKSPAISLTKTAAGTPAKAGDPITYSFVATNTGNVPLSSVAISDPLLAGKTITCAATTLAAGASTTCSVSSAYAVTQSNVDAGTVANTATVSGTPETGAAVTGTASTATPITRTARLKLEKSASGTPTKAGDQITYSFTVTNTGNTPVTGVAVNDPLVTGEACSPPTLAPGGVADCTSNAYTVTQADVNAGTVNNAATVTGTPLTGLTLTTDGTSSASTVTPLTRTTRLKIAKAASGTPTAAGDKITYTFTVTNTGNTSVTGVGVNDGLVTGETCSPTTLAPGASASCTADQYTATQGDVDSGTVVNTATPTGAGPTGAATVTADPTSTGQTTTPITRAAKLKIVKSASGTPTKTGDKITYTFTVTNTGNTSVTGVGVNDALVTGEICSPTTLAPGASASCTANQYTVVQGDVDAGTVVNTATPTGTGPSGAATVTVDPSSTGQTTTPITAAGQLDVTLAQSSASITAAGQTISYTYSVQNTGNVSLTSLAVTDSLGNTLTCPTTSLAPGASTTCTSTYTVKQADVEAGRVLNTASGKARTPANAAVTDASAQVEKTIAANAQLTTTLAASGSPTKKGDEVVYTMTVENTGNVAVKQLVATDDLGNTYTCAASTLAPGASTTCTSTYEVTQADVNAGEVDNGGTAVGVHGTSTPVSDDSNDVSTPIAAAAELTTTVVATGMPTKKGDEITYTATVKNTGSITVDEVVVTDELGNTYACSVTVLEPGESATCTATYAVTQADVDAGEVENIATGAGETPAGTPVSDASPQVDTPIAAAAELTTTLVASGSPVRAGDEISYVITIRNTGDVTVRGVVPTINRGEAWMCEDSTLAPGESTTCEALLAVTQADVDAGEAQNFALGGALFGPGAGTLVEDESNHITTPIAPAAELTTTLTQSTGAVTQADDTITYTYEVENSGNVTVDTIEVTDTLGNTITCSVATLAPGESATCTATYEVTQADVDAGEVVNTATAEGLDPKDTAVADDCTEVEKTIAAAGSVAIGLTQSAATVTDAGDGVLYFYAVENTGNVTLNDVQVTDALGNTITCAASIAPGATIFCTSTYAVTQGDVDAGRVDNTASAAATPTRGADVDDESTTVSKLIAADPELTTTVVPSGTPTEQGDEITYTATVENTGNVTVDHMVVTDDLGNSYTCDVTTLAPGATAECTTAYPVTQADIDAGEVVNTATGGGLDPSDDPVSDPTSEVTTPITQHPELSTTLLDSGTPAKAGDPITYTMTVENVGNVTIDELVVTDDLGTTYTCDVTELAPDERAECLATYPVTQADVDASVVENGGSVRGEDPKGYAVAVTANDVDTTIPAAAELTTTLVPSGSPTKKGDQITWTATVKNTGNVTVDQMVVTDDLGNAYTCDFAELAPAASATCTATDPVTQAEVNAGEVVNTATGAAVDPSDDDVSDDSPVARVTIAPGAALTVTLDQSTATVTKKGDEITYAYTVENTGNVTVDDLVVTDDLVNTLTCDVTELAPGETAKCTATYPVSQADVDAGEVENTATAAGLTPAAVSVTGHSNTVRKPIAAAPALTTTLDSAGSPTTGGDDIVFTSTVENTGNVTVDDVVVTDELGNTYACDVTELAPGATATCAATYPVTQADVDAGEVENTATGSGEDPSGDAVTDDSDRDRTPIPADPELTSTVVASGTPERSGDEIVYTVTVENTGNVTVDDVVVTDELGNTYVCDVTELAPGATATCTATYPVTQADVDAGEVENTATGSGEDPSGDAVTDATDEVVVPLTADPALTITDASVDTLVDADHDGRDSAGDTVVYTYEVRNTGNVTLTDAEVTDTLGTVVACVPARLAPGVTAPCVSATVPVTQTQVDAGRAETRGTASATPPSGSPVQSVESDLLVTPLTPVSVLGVVTRIESWKDVNGDGVLNAGDLVLYAFDVSNNGTVTLDGLTVEDERLAGQRIAIDCAAPLARLGALAAGVGGPSLAPGQSTTCAGSQGYVVTADDVQRRTIANSAEAGAIARGTSAPVDATSNVVTSVPVASPKLTLTTDADVKDTNGNGRTDAGDQVTYAYTVTNAGDIRLENVTVTDDHLAEQGITISCEPSTLAPGETATCSASGPYVITGADVKNGTIVSNAVARGEDPVGGVTTSVESDEVESVVRTQTEAARSAESRIEKPRNGILPDAGGPAAAAGALGVAALGLGLGLVGAARRRRVDEAA